MKSQVAGLRDELLESDASVLTLLEAPWLLSCHFQPLVTLADRLPVGDEALLRVGRDGAPQLLLEAARRRGRIDEVDELGRALALSRVRAGRSTLLFLNCEIEVLLRGEASALAEAVGAVGLSPAQVVVELVETVRAPCLADLEHGVRAFRDAGFKLALDDVGSGWSSLNLVAALEPDVLKVDREVIARLPGHGASCVVRLLVDLARSLGAHTVAEGVETEREHDAARRLGLEWGQGWLYGRPRDPLAS